MTPNFLKQVFERAEITGPDGRQLHAYGLSDEIYDQIEATLASLPRALKRKSGWAGLYVLWAAERIRRHYDGAGLSWEFINAPMPRIFEGTSGAGVVQLGLDYWFRPLRRGLSGHRLFMYSLMAEGGIPLAVLEKAKLHAQVLRDMIDEIGRRGGVTTLGYETALDIAQQKMRYLPYTLKGPDTVALFVDLAQAIYDLREALPKGLSQDQIEDWLNRERSGWERDLPLRLTPAIIENIIRPSLAVVHKERPKAPLARREIHLGTDGRAMPVAILSAEAKLPLAALPGSDKAMLRLVPRFISRRPLVYRVMKATEGGTRDLERLGATGPEVLPLDLGASLDFDVMDDNQILGPWTALSALPPPEEAPSFWAGQETLGDRLRLRQLSGGKTRAESIWVALAPDADAELSEGLVPGREVEVVGARLVELNGSGHVRLGAQTLRIETGAESDSEPAALYFLGKLLSGWRLVSGDAIYLGRPTVHGQRGEGPLMPLGPGQVRRGTRPNSLYGAEFWEWVADDEQLAVARTVSVPSDVKILATEIPTGGLNLIASGLPPGLILDLRAGDLVAHGRTGTAPLALSLPTRAPETAFVTLTLTEIASGRSLELTAPWPATQPHFIRDGRVLPPRDLDLSFDQLAGISYLAPGTKCGLAIDLVNGRGFDLRISGMAPLVRQEDLLRRLLAQGTADNSASVSLHNSAGRSGRINLRRYHGQMHLQGDLLTLGLAADLARGAMLAPEQRPGTAELHLLQLETGEVRELSATMKTEALNLREASGIETGLWLVQGRFDGLQQRPVAWTATPPEAAEPTPRSTRDARIEAYRRDFEVQAEAGSAATGAWRKLLQLILSARDGGDPAMLDQFHALAQCPAALAAMLVTLRPPEVSALFALEGYWSVFWPAFPLRVLVEAVTRHLQATISALILAGQHEQDATAMTRQAIIGRLALLRDLRPDLAGHVAVVLIEAGLLADVARDQRFDGLLLPNPQKALAEAVQVIARSDPSLPRGINPLTPRCLARPDADFQRTVQLVVGAALATAEVSMGLAPSFGPSSRLDAVLVEAAAPDLFARALHPALFLAMTTSRT